MDKIKILTVGYKPFDMKANDAAYVPIIAGANNLKENPGTSYLLDNTGINISDKNTSYAELTAVYWAWKNGFYDDADIIGMTHYRRFFSGDSSQIISSGEISELMKTYDVITNGFCDLGTHTVLSQFDSCIGEARGDLAKMGYIIDMCYPEYSESYWRIMRTHKCRFNNIFIGKKELMYNYFEWIFTLCQDAEKYIDTKQYSSPDFTFAYIAERLFNVWLYHQHRYYHVRTKQQNVYQVSGMKENSF